MGRAQTPDSEAVLFPPRHLPVGPSLLCPHSLHVALFPTGEHRPRDPGADQDEPAGHHCHVLRGGSGEDTHPDGEGLLPAFPEVTRLPRPGCPRLGRLCLYVQLQPGRALTHLSLLWATRKLAGREVESPIPEAATPAWEAGSAQQVPEDSGGRRCSRARGSRSLSSRL